VRVRHPSRRAARIIAVCICIGSTLYLIADAQLEHRSFTLKYQDEFSYSIQTNMLAHGRLWMPAHPLPEFFDSFQFLATPIYGSIYFPGASLMYAPGAWLDLPRWLVPVLLSGIVAAMLY